MMKCLYLLEKLNLDVMKNWKSKACFIIINKSTEQCNWKLKIMTMMEIYQFHSSFIFIYLGTVVLSVHKNYFSRGCGTEIQHTRDETETEIWGRMERIIMLWCNALIAGISNGTLEHFGGAKLADSLESNLSQIWNTPKLCQMIFAGWNCLWNFWQ